MVGEDARITVTSEFNMDLLDLVFLKGVEI